MIYKDFLIEKEIKTEPTGFDCDALNENLFPFQSDIVRWALKKGKSALFLDTGLGKTICQLSWAYEVSQRERMPVLIVAPLAVSMQTKSEGKKFGISVNVCRSQSDVMEGINITNYEMLEHFDSSKFVGVILDESSILKSFSGRTTQLLIDKFKNTKYKLACTATPAPNDYQELGNHSEFLGIMSRTEMLSTFFVHDGGDTGKWRIKGHADSSFWKWVATWGCVLKTPKDLGYDDSRYELPELIINTIYVDDSKQLSGRLLPKLVSDLSDRRNARKDNLNKRVDKCVEICNDLESCIIWCDFNSEGDALSQKIEGSVEIAGKHNSNYKEEHLLGFANGDFRFLITKPKIAGFGMNWQNCNNIIFCGLSDSYERYYQAIRRCYRFGQTKPVNVYIVIGSTERPVLENIKKKELYASNMQKKMTKVATRIVMDDISNTRRKTEEYTPSVDMILPSWEEMKVGSN